MFIYGNINSYSASRYRIPKQGYVKKSGGSSKKTSEIEYDRGDQHYHRQIKPGQTIHIPRDATNTRINGLQVSPNSRSKINSKGATLFED